jgi:hypothetical protein
MFYSGVMAPLRHFLTLRTLLPRFQVYFECQSDITQDDNANTFSVAYPGLLSVCEHNPACVLIERIESGEGSSENPITVDALSKKSIRVLEWLLMSGYCPKKLMTVLSDREATDIFEWLNDVHLMSVLSFFENSMPGSLRM